ncbi:MAG: hypothetical protein H0W08_19040 [Acidobacteria bacterium]|nr:hypothetical protein [Acidobacteriota bacterium]
MPPDTRLTFTAAAGPLRRALVPSAWLVLEELALAMDGDRVAATNARRLAAALGLSKDTTARALNTLIELNVVRVEHRDEATGRFGTIRYRVDTERSGLVVDTRQTHGPSAPSPSIATALPRATRVSTSRPSPQPLADRDQLELFGD